MKTIPLTDANVRLSSLAIIMPYKFREKSKERKLGTLEGKVTVEFAKDFAMTTEEFINL